MARVKLNPLLEQVRGQIGDLVFKRYGDGVILSRKAENGDTPPSAAQLAHQQRFREATVYGRTVLADPDVREVYDDVAHRRGHPTFSVIVADFLNAPSVAEVDLSGYTGAVGDVIVVQAEDDFEVVAVHVTLSDGDGNALEAGDAVLGPDGRWTYTTTVAVDAGTTVRIGVSATDRPGGTGEHEVETTL